MDFPPEDIGPYDPYMEISLENIGRTTQKWPSEEKSDRNYNIEVRDSRTGYFIPVRYGMGLGQMEKLSASRRRRRRRRHLEMSLYQF